jgi:hypothetical protein
LNQSLLQDHSSTNLSDDNISTGEIHLHQS